MKIDRNSKMGNSSSHHHQKYTKKDFENLAKMTHFTAEQISILHHRFSAVSNSDTHDNKINVSEFRQALDIPSTGFTERIFSAFDTDKSQQIEFDEFVFGLSALSQKATVEEKAKFCFLVYDIDGNHTIDKQELTQILTFSMGQNTSIHLSDDQINKIVDSTFKKMDKNHDGGISLDEFTQCAKENPQILNCVNLNLDEIFRKYES